MDRLPSEGIEIKINSFVKNHSEAKLIPQDDKLIKAAYGEVKKMLESPEQVDITTSLQHVRTALNEVLLRKNRGFYENFYRQGCQLAVECKNFLETYDIATVPFPRPFPLDEDAQSNVSVLDEATKFVLYYNATLVDFLDTISQPEASELVGRLTNWELSLYQHRLESAMEASVDTVNALLISDRFENFIAKKKPEWPNFHVKSFKRLPGGYSKITILAECQDDQNGDHGVVIRGEPKQRMLDLEGMRLTLEYPLIEYVYKKELPIAEPILLEKDSSILGVPFAVFRKMPGSIIGTYQEANATLDENLVKDVINLMVRIANTPIDKNDPLIKSSYINNWIHHENLAENTRELIKYWYDTGITGNMSSSPLMKCCVNWLLSNVPEDGSRMNLIHGDIGFHNILFEGSKLSAILDWENSRFGDSAEDLSLFIRSVKGQFDREQIIEWYREVGGPEISEYRLRYFDVFHCFKIIISALVCLQRVEENPENHAHLASFGLLWLHGIAQEMHDLIALAEKAKCGSSNI